MTEDTVRLAGSDFDWCRKLHGSGMLTDAIECYRQLLERDSANASVHHFLGMALLAEADHAQAAAHLKRAAQLEPGNADIWNDLGVASEAIGALEDAEAAFRRCLTLAPQLAEPRANLAQSSWA